LTGWNTITMETLKLVLNGRQWKNLVFQDCMKLVKGFEGPWEHEELSSLVSIDLSIKCIPDSEIAAVAKYARKSLKSLRVVSIGESIQNILLCENLEHLQAHKFLNLPKNPIKGELLLFFDY
jgi:hypothetical protein